jgi:hypothetical protein
MKYYGLMFIAGDYRGIIYVGDFKTRKQALKADGVKSVHNDEIIHVVDSDQLKTIGEGALHVLHALNRSHEKLHYSR